MTGALNGVNYVETGYAYCRNLGTDNHSLSFSQTWPSKQYRRLSHEKESKEAFSCIVQQQNGIFWLQNWFLSFQDSAIVLSGVRLDQFQYTFLHILSMEISFFSLPGVSLSFNYIPLVNEVNLQIIYYSDLGNGNGPFAGGGELKCFSPS